MRHRFSVYIARPPPEINKTLWRGVFPAPLKALVADVIHNAGSWQRGLMRRTYNPVKRVRARSEGPNPSGPVIMVTCG